MARGELGGHHPSCHSLSSFLPVCCDKKEIITLGTFPRVYSRENDDLKVFLPWSPGHCADPGHGWEVSSLQGAGVGIASRKGLQPHWAFFPLLFFFFGSTFCLQQSKKALINSLTSTAHVSRASPLPQQSPCYLQPHRRMIKCERLPPRNPSSSGGSTGAAAQRKVYQTLCPFQTLPLFLPSYFSCRSVEILTRWVPEHSEERQNVQSPAAQILSGGHEDPKLPNPPPWTSVSPPEVTL